MVDGGRAHRHTQPSNPTMPVWPIALLVAGLILYAFAPQTSLLPAGIAALVVFASALYVFPACRPGRGLAISPLGWALFLFGLSMVACPILISFFGPTRSTLPSMPDSTAISLASVLTTVAFVAFCVGFTIAYGRVTRRPRDPGIGWFRSPFPRWVPAVFVCVGLIGMALSFGSPGDLLAYLSSPSEVRAAAAEEATYQGFLGLILRPFLGFGLIMIWCRSVDATPRSRRAALARLALVVSGVLVSYGTFGFNRASIAYPLVGVIAVYSRRIRRIGIVGLACIAVVSLLLLGAIGIYRSGSSTAGEFVGVSGRAAIRDELDLNQEIQGYGGAPQFLAFVMTRAETMPPAWGRAIVSGVVAPVPILGEPFRETSGTGLYNAWIYGSAGFRDQVIPFAGELFIDLRVPGVVIGFLLLGALVARLHAGFVRATTALGAFVAQYIGMWVAFPIIGSAEVVSQTFVYFLWPIYATIAYAMLRIRGDADAPSERLRTFAGAPRPRPPARNP
jgi:hypothetical protein